MSENVAVSHHAPSGPFDRQPFVALLDPHASARAAHLRYVDDTGPGFQRRKHGKAFRYLDTNGKPLRDPSHLDRIRRLAIPPAWTEVWICPLAHGHLQATGRDARQRKQYRYHADFRAIRDQTKYERLLAFARALPRIRTAVGGELARAGLTREKVLATVVRLLEATLIRVGNEEYARQNKSFGLTTLREDHVAIEGTVIHFHFRGKSGIEHTIDVRDRRLARILHQCQELPGEVLFQYAGDDGELHAVEAHDVNAYIHQVAGDAFSAKDFRTWAGTVLTLRELSELGTFETMTAAKKNVVSAIKSVARKLHNTPAVCRKCYVHPAVVNAYLDGRVTRTANGHELGSVVGYELTSEESALVELLRGVGARPSASGPKTKGPRRRKASEIR